MCVKYYLFKKEDVMQGIEVKLRVIHFTFVKVMRIETEDGLAQDEDRKKDDQHFGNHDVDEQIVRWNWISNRIENKSMTVWKTERRSNVAAAQVTQKYTTKWLEIYRIFKYYKFRKSFVTWRWAIPRLKTIITRNETKKIQRNWKWRDLICYRIQILCDCVKYILS